MEVKGSVNDDDTKQMIDCTCGYVEMESSCNCPFLLPNMICYVNQWG